MKKRITGAKTSLERAVQRWANEQARDYDNGATGPLTDLMKGGCQSGMVSELISYSDTVKFYKRHRDEIAAILSISIEEMGVSGVVDLFGDKWDKTDPLSLEHSNQNLLAWYGFEETARTLAQRNEIDL